MIITENQPKIVSKVEQFFNVGLPEEYKNRIADLRTFKTIDAETMQKSIYFERPFIRTERMVLFKEPNECMPFSYSIGIGKVYPVDMKGHYNSTIYLAFAGRLMPSTAAIHLSCLFPETSPQAIEGKSIRMDERAYNKGLIQPAENGTTFYVQTKITKKKMTLVLVNTKVYFGKANFGLIENLVFVLTQKDSIFNARVAPEVYEFL